MKSVALLALLFSVPSLVQPIVGSDAKDAKSPVDSQPSPKQTEQKAKSKKTKRQQHCDNAAADKMKGAAWCQWEYVDAKDCDDWIADECEWNLEKDEKKGDSDDAK